MKDSKLELCEIKLLTSQRRTFGGNEVVLESPTNGDTAVEKSNLWDNKATSFKITPATHGQKKDPCCSQVSSFDIFHECAANCDTQLVAYLGLPRARAKTVLVPYTQW